jgi:O-antigen ligase
VRLVVGGAERGPIPSTTLAVGSLLLLTATVFTGAPPVIVTPAVAFVVAVAVAYRVLLAWRNLVGLLILVIMLIPIRFSLPGSLPFQLEPYRILVLLLLVAWITGLLIDPRIRFRRSGLEAPLFLLLFATLGSELLNTNRLASVGTAAIKSLTFFLSYILCFYLIVSVVRTRAAVDFLVKLLVATAGIVAILAVYEARTDYNVFNHLLGPIPFLKAKELPYMPGRGGRLRTYASAQHPIALSAALVMMVPLAGYLAKRTGNKRWALVILPLLMGALGTVSRTAVLMLIAMTVVLLRTKPQLKRYWPLLVPGLAAIHIALPATLGPLKSAFFPQGGLIAQQTANAGQRGSGRVADLGPSLAEWKNYPLFGEGFGTRIVELGKANALILDDQWLGTLLETGLIGFISWWWLFGRTVRRLTRRAKEDDSADSWLFVGIAASVAGFAISMFTYDAFAFIQVTFLLFILLGLACSLLSVQTRHGPPDEAA